jgi:hypothetical protein
VYSLKAWGQELGFGFGDSACERVCERKVDDSDDIKNDLVASRTAAAAASPQQVIPTESDWQQSMQHVQAHSKSFRHSQAGSSQSPRTSRMTAPR